MGIPGLALVTTGMGVPTACTTVLRTPVLGLSVPLYGVLPAPPTPTTFESHGVSFG